MIPEDSKTRTATSRAVAQQRRVPLGGHSGGICSALMAANLSYFRSPFREDLLSTNISSLWALPSGGLWIGYLSGGAVFLRQGAREN